MREDSIYYNINIRALKYTLWCRVHPINIIKTTLNMTAMEDYYYYYYSYFDPESNVIQDD